MIPVTQTKKTHPHRPLTNAERQQRWRNKHVGRKRKALLLASPGGVSSPAQQIGMPLALPSSSALMVADDLKAIYRSTIRPLSASQRLQLARLILADLAA